MIKQVNVVVVKATASDYNAEGVSKAVNCASGFVNEVYIATENYQERVASDCKAGEEVGVQHPVQKEKVLKMTDQNLGLIYVRETLESFSAKCEACCVQP